MAWETTTVGELRPGDTVIRNVRPGYEWAPGPYGAFVVRDFAWRGDEVSVVAESAAGGGRLQTFRYDRAEEVFVRRRLDG